MRTLFAWMGASLLLASSARAQDLGEVKSDPLGDVAADMKVVSKQLQRLSTGKPTQENQKAIVASLDEIIAELEKECAACRGGASGNRPTKPLNASQIIGGPGGIGDLHAPKQNGKKWGELPSKDRDRILQSMTEGFPAHYQQVLERYYRRLADEKSPAESTEKTKAPTPAPEAPAKSPAKGG